MEIEDEDKAFDELMCELIIKALGDHIIRLPYQGESPYYGGGWTVQYRRGHFNKGRIAKDKTKLGALKKAYTSVFNRGFDAIL